MRSASDLTARARIRDAALVRFGMGVIGFGMILWGLIAVEVWPTVFGATVVVTAQLWRIDRCGWLWERHEAQRS